MTTNDETIFRKVLIKSNKKNLWVSGLSFTNNVNCAFKFTPEEAAEELKKPHIVNEDCEIVPYNSESEEIPTSEQPQESGDADHDLADQVHRIYEQLPDCNLKKHLALWFDFQDAETLKKNAWIGDAEKFLEESINQKIGYSEGIISKTNALKYARMKVEEETKRCKKIFDGYEKLNTEIRDELKKALEDSEHNANQALKIAKERDELQSEIDQLKSHLSAIESDLFHERGNNETLENELQRLKSADGVFVDDTAITVKATDEYSDADNRYPFISGAKWTRDLLAPIINNADNKIGELNLRLNAICKDRDETIERLKKDKAQHAQEFAEWVCDKWTPFEKHLDGSFSWIRHLQEKTMTTSELYALFL